MILSVVIALLAATNILTIYWALRFRGPIDKKLRLIKSAISEFEAKGYALIEFRRINPDNIFLRNPERE
jgi:hypothetical protein